MPTSLTNNLVHIRNAKGLDQQDLAKKAKVSQQALSAYERGIRAPKHEALCRIAKALGVRPEELDPRLATTVPADLAPLCAAWNKLPQKTRTELKRHIRRLLP